MSLFEDIGLFLRPPDLRSKAQVEDEIAEELEFHLAMRQRDNEQAGMASAAARRDAEERFGDFEAIRSACARIHTGEWRVLQRIHLVLSFALLGVVVFLGWQFVGSRAETAELVGELRGDIGALADALREREAAAAAPAEDGAGAALFVDTDGDGLPDRRVAPGAGRALEPDPPTPDAWRRWLARFDETTTWRQAAAIGHELAALPPDLGLEILRELFPRIPTVVARQQVLKAFALGDGHPRALEVIDLAARDPDLAVQGWAFGYLKDYAFRDFSGDYDGYLAWSARHAGRPLAQVLEESARELAARLATLSGDELARELRLLEDLDLGKGPPAGVDLAGALRDAGLLDSIRSWISATDGDARTTAVRWLESLDPGEAWLRREVLPLLDAGGDAAAARDPGLVSAACSALGRPGNAWAIDPLVESLRWTAAGDDGAVFAHASALAEIGDPRAIPALIALLASDDTYTTVYGVGYFGLQPLTGVAYDESHDGAWWRAWWAANRQRLPGEARALEVPGLSFHR